MQTPGAAPVLLSAAGGRWKDVTNAWISLRRLPRAPHDAISEEDAAHAVELPLFQSEWQAEFDETQINVVQFKLLAAFVGIPVAGVTFYYVLYTDIGGEWTALQWGGYCLVAFVSLLTIVIYTTHWAPVRRYSMLHFEGLAGTAIVLTFSGIFSGMSFALESRGQNM